MAQINFADHSLTCKIVYCGPGLSGKTTNLEYVYERVPAAQRGELTSIQTYGDRTIFYDYLPIDLGSVLGLTTRIQLYTVPGQPYYAATRKLVLVGVDGIVFVADSQQEQLIENIESLQELQEELKEHDVDLRTLPLVFQWNKRDLPNALSSAELEQALNTFGAPTFETVANRGEGVMPCLRKLSRLVLERCRAEYGSPQEKQKRKTEPARPPLGLESQAAIAPPAPGTPGTPTETVEVQQGAQGRKTSDMDDTQEDADEPIGNTVGGCVILSKLGEGGMGTAYLARHQVLKKDFVVKTLKPKQAQNSRSVKRFFQEARSTARLEHENVVRVQDVGTSERGMHYMIMQYVEGENLEELVKRKGPFPQDEAARVVLEVARALKATHGAGVIHRDVKPQNIVVAADGSVKLIDFGLARDMDDQARLTQEGALVGTPAYMAPEMLKTRDFDGRVDLFALGLTFYYLLTAETPFLGSDINELFLGKGRLEQPETFVPDLNPAYKLVLEKFLAQAPESRYRSAALAIRDLLAIQRGEQIKPPGGDRFWLWEAKLLRESDEDTRVLEDPVRKNLLKRALETDPGPQAVEAPVPEELAEAVALAARKPKNRLGECILLERLERGAVGSLFRAWDPRKGRQVMLRVVPGFERIDSKSRRRFDAVSKMRNDHVLPLVGYGVERNKLFFMHKLREGHTLSSFRFKPKRVVQAMRDVSRALAYAWKRGVAHRGLQPESILIDPEGRGAVMDFALEGAIRRAIARGATEVPRISTRYKAPECFRGLGDERSEVYALGAVLYFGLTRQPPGTGAIVPPRQLARGIPRQLEAIVLKALEQAPDDRYGSQGELGDALHRFLEQGRAKSS